MLSMKGFRKGMQAATMAKLSWTVVAKYARYKARVWSAIEGLASLLRISSRQIVRGRMLLQLDLLREVCFWGSCLQYSKSEDNNYQGFL